MHKNCSTLSSASHELTHIYLRSFCQILVFARPPTRLCSAWHFFHFYLQKSPHATPNQPKMQNVSICTSELNLRAIITLWYQPSYEKGRRTTRLNGFLHPDTRKSPSAPQTRQKPHQQPLTAHRSFSSSLDPVEPDRILLSSPAIRSLLLQTLDRRLLPFDTRPNEHPLAPTDQHVPS